MNRFTFAVTFEFPERPPITHRGTVDAEQPSTAARKAIKEAQRTLKPIKWTSMNFVILEC